MAKLKTDRRQISETGKVALKAVAAKYPNQKFSVYVMGQDEEAYPFATQICKFLVHEYGKIGWADEIIVELNSVFEADEIALAHKFGSWRRLAGGPEGTQSPSSTIEFNAGRRPA